MRSFIFFSIMISLSGCNKISTSQLETKNIAVTKLQVFEPSNLRMVQNRYFLWKEDFTVDQKMRASDVADQLDVADNYLNFELPLIFPNEILADDTNYKKLKEQIGILEAAIKKLVGEIEVLKKELENPNLTDEQKLAKKTSIDTKTKSVTKKAADKLTKGNELHDKFGNLNMEDFIAAKDAADKKATTLSDSLRDQTEFNSNPPKFVYLEFDKEGQPQVRFDEWQVLEYNSDTDGSQLRNFSSYTSEEMPIPTIKNIKYTALGGRWEFDIVTDLNWDGANPKIVYHFDIARNAYTDKYSRIILFGDMTRTRLFPGGNIETRNGIAKLVNVMK